MGWPLFHFLDRFEDSETGRRRLFFFAIGAANGFLSYVGAMTVLMTNIEFWWISVLLTVFGTSCLLFAAHVVSGGVEWLVRKDHTHRPP